MQTESRKIRPSVIKKLFKKPFTFGFFQSVRLLQMVSKAKGSNDQTETQDLIHFKSRLSLETPSAEVHDLTGEIPKSEVKGLRKPLSMVVNFLGLTGSSGALPSNYTEFLIERQVKYRDRALRDFLDIFNHRFIDLFYKAWAKHRLYVDWEEQRQNGILRNILDFMGYGSQNLRSKLAIENTGISDLNLAYYSGIMVGSTRTAEGLSRIINDHFGMKNEVLQFRGQWMKNPDDQCTSLGEYENILGEGSMLGVMYWDQQASFRVRLGPLKLTDFQDMLPNQVKFEALSKFIEFYAGPSLDFDIQLVLKRDEVPDCLLGGKANGGSHLGWSSWLCPVNGEEDLDHSVFKRADRENQLRMPSSPHQIH